MPPERHPAEGSSVASVHSAYGRGTGATEAAEQLRQNLRHGHTRTALGGEPE